MSETNRKANGRPKSNANGSSAAGDSTGNTNEHLKVPTDLSALADGPSYVRAVASQVDLVGASAKLVVSNDEKIAKAELDRLRELIFGKGGPAPADETPRIDWTGIPRPERELPTFNQVSGGERDDH